MLSFLFKGKRRKNQSALNLWTCKILSLVLITASPFWGTDTLSVPYALCRERKRCWPTECVTNKQLERPASRLLEQRMLRYRPWKRASSHSCEQDLQYHSSTHLKGVCWRAGSGYCTSVLFPWICKRRVVSKHQWCRQTGPTGKEPPTEQFQMLRLMQ